MPRPRSREDYPPHRLLTKHGLLTKYGLPGEDDSADRGEHASMEADEDTAAMTNECDITSSVRDAPECILKLVMDELGRLNAYSENLVANMSLQLQDMKQEILMKFDGQDLQISTVREQISRVQEHRIGVLPKDDVEDAPPSDGSVQGSLKHSSAKDTLSQNPNEKEAAANPILLGEIEQKPHANSMQATWSWKREATPQDMEAADEHHRRASAAFSAQQRSATFPSAEQEAKMPSRLQAIVYGTAFESVSMLIIMTNAVFVGVQTELATLGSDEQDGPIVFAINVAYTLVFSVELALKLYVSGWSFFVSRSRWQWNLLDTLTVLASIFECTLGLVIRMSGQSAKVQGLSQFRVLRMLRLVRLLRGLKIARIIKSIRALRTLVHQILFTVKSMMWAMLLLFVIIYLFAVSFTQATNMYRIDAGFGSLELEQHVDPRLHKYWSSLPRSMFTLFLSITGGISWDEAATPLSDVGGVWVVLFLAYICFAQMAVLNVITGYFCQSAVEGAALDPKLVAQKVLSSKRMYKDRIAEIFVEIDTDRSGFITLHEFEEHLEDDHTKAYFDSLGIDASDVWSLFKLMDADSGHEIDLEEFTTGCMRLRGGATSLDLAKLAYDHNYMGKRLGKFMARTDRVLSQLIDGSVGPHFDRCGTRP